MNLITTNRRQELPVRLGNHGYRLDGDYALLQAELHVPPYLSGQGFRLELWACPAPHSGGDLQGIKIAELSLDLPTPIGPHLHRVEARAPLSPPQGAAEHAMVLVLASGAGEGRRVQDFANYGRSQRFAGPELGGAVGYSIEGDSVVLSAGSVLNRRPEGNVSGSLCLELWALGSPYAGGTPHGHRLAVADLGNVFGQYHLPELTRRVAFTPPAPGRWHVVLLLREWTLASGYVTRDQRAFDVLYEQAAQVAERASSEPAHLASVAPIASARSTAKRRPLEPSDSLADTPVENTKAAPAAARAIETAPPVPAPPAASSQRLLSVHTASLEELAKLPGLSLKVAKEIVKNRPFASLDALLSVRGIGEKTLRRIKALLTM
jgi:DNA uptake protein ComE-like DNA-binding protein